MSPTESEQLWIIKIPPTGSKKQSKKKWIINIWQVPLFLYAYWEKQQVFALGREKSTLSLKFFCFLNIILQL